MQLNSYIFILLFLPAAAGAWYGIGKKSFWGAKVSLAILSALFYLYAGWQSGLLLLGSLAVNYALLKPIRGKKGKHFFILGIVLNLGVLGYCKYANFFLETVSEVFSLTFTERHILLPLGLSFFTFQQIAFLADTYQGKLKDVDLLDYSLFVLFFPKLVMGPLASPKALLEQFQNPQILRPNGTRAAGSMQLFALGLFKKVVLADVFAKAVAPALGAPASASALQIALGILSYTMQIYFDFSGYSDMALASAGMLGIDLPVNFNSPYKSLSIRDFWKRWHMSLTRFFTTYVYIPLGGNRRGSVITARNTMIVFLLSGLWHGASWTFVLWGALHGLLSLGERFFSGERLPKLLRWAGTFLLVNLLWALFCAPDVGTWLAWLRGLLSFTGGLREGFMEVYFTPLWKFAARVLPPVGRILNALPWIPAAGYLGLGMAICLGPENAVARKKSLNFWTLLLTAFCLIYGITCLSGESTFLYMNF